jgi:hypothetical protein
VVEQRGVQVGADREIQALVKRAMPIKKGGEGLGIGQFISLLS